jgi:dihydrofolate synthase/folylpolyglutamate synthase
MNDTPPAFPPALPETFRDCLDFFYARNQFAIKLGLDNVNALLDRLGRPDAGLTFLHVAGTNGKGSVCANLAALLSATGRRRVGLYTSPHLVSFRERILVDGEPIPADFIVAWLRGAQTVILELGATYFECVTALALDYFKFRGCEAVVLETGLGGRLDATNAVRPALTVVTSVSLDHTSILGDTVEEIWGEKIGILKPGVPMVVREDRPHLLAALKAKADSMGSPVIALGDFPFERTGQESREGGAITFHGRYATYVFPSGMRPEDHQVENLRLAMLAMETFLRGPLPPAEALIPFLRDAKLPGRTQLLEETGMLPVLLDGAHNPGGMAVLEAHLRRVFPGRRVSALFAVMRDKDFASVFRSVRGFASEVLFVPLAEKFPRALSYADLTEALTPEERASVRPFPLEASALEELLRIPGGPAGSSGVGVRRENSGSPDLVVVCGSLYLLGEVIPMLLPHYRGLDWFKRFVGEG